MTKSPLAPLLQRGDYIKLFLLLMFVSELTYATDEFKTVDATVPFAGAWLSEDYYTSIKKFRSPRKAQAGSEYLVIPDRTLIQGVRGFNFHEGIDLIVFKNNQKYQIRSNGKLSDVDIISPEKIRLEEKTFVKIDPVRKKRHGIELVLEEILFKGEYKNTDGKIVEFKRDGQVIGLHDIKYYSPQMDYYDVGLDIDLIILGKIEDDLDVPLVNISKWLGFQFKKDILELYRVKCFAYDNFECIQIGFGELVYKLQKIK